MTSARGGVVRPNTLSAPGEHAARERVEVVFAAVDRLTATGLFGLAVPRRDPIEREALLADLERIAGECGRGRLLDEARALVRDGLLARATERAIPGTALAAVWPVARAEDEVAVVTAIEDAVSVAVVEDRLPAATADTLAGPGRRLLGLRALDDGPEAGRGAAPAWAPSASDWADAALEMATADDDHPMPGVRRLRAVVITAVALVGVPTAIAMGFEGGQPFLGVLGAATVIALCWTVATHGSGRRG